MWNMARGIPLMALFGYFGLAFPDIDQFLLPVLHHRSILTHSLLVPALLMSSARSVPISLAACGFLLGVAVHLSADVLSRPVGFGMIWLPWPITATLGEYSPYWIGGHALLGLIWAKRVLYRLQYQMAMAAYLGLAVLYGVTYALFHERALLPLVSFAGFFIVALLFTEVAGPGGRASWRGGAEGPRPSA